MSFLQLTKIFTPVSAVVAVASIGLLIFWPLRLGIEFTGGTLMEVILPADQSKTDLEGALASFTPPAGEAPLEVAAIGSTSNGSLLVRMKEISNETHIALLEHLQAEVGEVNEILYSTIGPTVSEHLKGRAVWALGIALVAIVLYISAVFRRVSGHLTGWDYGFASIIALVHDVLVTLGMFTILSHLTTFEADILFVTALLSMMGYSVNDTIVIFDRIRENLRETGNRLPFRETVQKSLRESLMRTLNTGMGAFIMLLALFFLGPQSLRWFILALIAGTLIGTYSSFFVATPWLMLQYKRKHPQKK
jgi:preprotein translocase subunit SecF